MDGDRLPDFFVIGAMKAGTTSLYEYLCRHPGIFMPENKEPMYFSHEKVYRRGEDWYRSLFSQAQPDQICGEASTSYSRWPQFDRVPERIAGLVPDTRFIYMMRHPVKRAYSHYAFLMQHEDRVISFEEALERLPVIIDASLYVRQIERYLKYFSTDRLHLVVMDDFVKDPDRVLVDIQAFLGLEVVSLSTEKAVIANRSGEIAAGRRIRGGLKSFRRWPLVRHVVDVVPTSCRQGVFRSLLKMSKKSPGFKSMASGYAKKFSPMKDETRQRLFEVFEKPTQELESMLGRQLPEWYS